MNDIEKARQKKLEKYKKAMEAVFGGPGSGRNPGEGSDIDSNENNDEYKPKGERAASRIEKQSDGSKALVVRVGDGKTFAKIDQSLVGDLQTMKVNSTIKIQDSDGRKLEVTKVRTKEHQDLYNVKSGTETNHFKLK
jgi:hypothetical protein